MAAGRMRGAAAGYQGEPGAAGYDQCCLIGASCRSIARRVAPRTYGAGNNRADKRERCVQGGGAEAHASAAIVVLLNDVHAVRLLRSTPVPPTAHITWEIGSG